MTSNKSNRRVSVGLVQMQCSDDPQDNVDRALGLTGRAADAGARVICLPELFRSRYFCQTEDAAFFDLAEAVPGPTTDRFAALAAERDLTLIVSVFERRAAGLYHNTLAVIDGKQGYLGKYRKMHIPDDPRYYEKYYFTPGDLGFRSFDTTRGQLGTLICWDQWYPEAARLTAMQGAEILFYPTAIGWHPAEKESHGVQQHAAWETMQRSHAIANGCYVVAVNRFGFEPDPAIDGGIEFWGQSFMVAPSGQVICRAPVDEECVLVEEIDLGAIDEMRHGWPFLRDRRIDAYDPITQRYLTDAE